jgi:hypothetical protein
MKFYYYDYDRAYCSQRLEEIFKIHQNEYSVSDLTIYEIATLVKMDIVRSLNWGDERLELAASSYKSLVKAQLGIENDVRFQEIGDLGRIMQSKIHLEFLPKLKSLISPPADLPFLFKGFFNVNNNHDIVPFKIKVFDEQMDVMVESWQIEARYRDTLRNNLEKRCLDKLVSVETLTHFYEKSSETLDSPPLAESLWEWLNTLPTLDMWKRETARSFHARGKTLKKLDEALKRKDTFVNNEKIKRDIVGCGELIIKFSQNLLEVVEEYKNKKVLEHGTDEGEADGWKNSPRFASNDARSYMHLLLQSTQTPSDISSKLDVLNESLLKLGLYRRGGLSWYLCDLFAGKFINEDTELQNCLGELRKLEKVPLSSFGVGLSAAGASSTSSSMKKGIQQGFSYTPAKEVAVDNIAFAIPGTALISFLCTAAKGAYSVYGNKTGSRDLVDEKKYGGMKQATYYDQLSEIITDYNHQIYKDIGKSAIKAIGELGGPAGKAVTSALGSVTDLVLQYKKLKSGIRELSEIKNALDRDKVKDLESLYHLVSRSKFMTSHLTREKGLVAIWNTGNFSRFAQMQREGTLSGVSERSNRMLSASVGASCAHMDNSPFLLYRKASPIYYLSESALMAQAIDLNKRSNKDKLLGNASDMVHQLKHKYQNAQVQKVSS